jgi:RimJ/RimL family protein N-acetyltransferase
VRRLGDADRDELVGLFAIPEVWHFEYDRGLSEEETDAFLDRQQGLWVDHGFGGCAVRTITDRGLLGVVGLGVPVLAHAALPPVTAGWRFGPDAWGHGYATEAATALLDQAFTTMRIACVGCVTNADNSKSIAVAERLGMHPVGEATVPRDDGTREVRATLLAVTTDEWTTGRAVRSRPGPR